MDYYEEEENASLDEPAKLPLQAIELTGVGLVLAGWGGCYVIPMLAVEC